MVKAPQIKIRDDEHVVFAGTTGTGKTELVKHLLLGLNRVTVIDTKNELNWPGFRISKNLPFYGDDWHIIYRPRRSEAGDLDLADFIQKLYRKKKNSIYVDELFTIKEFFPNTLNELAEIMRVGRSRHVRIWFGVQRPKWVPPFFLSESRVRFQFYLNLFGDRVFMAQFSGEEAVDKIPFHHFWYSRVGDQFPHLMTLDIPKSVIIAVDNLTGSE